MIVHAHARRNPLRSLDQKTRSHACVLTDIRRGEQRLDQKGDHTHAYWPISDVASSDWIRKVITRMRTGRYPMWRLDQRAGHEADAMLDRFLLFVMISYFRDGYRTVRLHRRVINLEPCANAFDFKTKSALSRCDHVTNQGQTPRARLRTSPLRRPGDYKRIYQRLFPKERLSNDTGRTRTKCGLKNQMLQLHRQQQQQQLQQLKQCYTWRWCSCWQANWTRDRHAPCDKFDEIGNLENSAWIVTCLWDIHLDWKDIQNE